MINQQKLNHYYPAASIALAYSTNPETSDLRESKVNAINIFEIFELIRKYKTSKETQKMDFFNFCMSQPKKKFLCNPTCSEILTDEKLIEEKEVDKQAQATERKFLEYLRDKSIFSKEVSSILAKDSINPIKDDLIKFFNLIINRSPLYSYLIKEDYPGIESIARIGSNDILLNICKTDHYDSTMCHDNLFSDLMPIVPLNLSSLFLVLKESFEWTDEEFNVLQNNKIWIFNYSATHFFLIFPASDEVNKLLYLSPNQMNTAFINKVKELYAHLILLYTFRYIIYHPSYNEIIKYIIEYYYDLYENTIEFRKRIGISNFKDFLHLKK